MYGYAYDPEAEPLTFNLSENDQSNGNSAFNNDENTENDQDEEAKLSSNTSDTLELRIISSDNYTDQ